MKPSFVTAVFVSMLIPLTGHAAPAERLTAAELGGIESALNYCEGVAPSHAAQLRRKAQELLKGVNEDRIEEMKRTPDYKSVYTAVTGIFHGIPKDEGIELCAAASK